MIPAELIAARGISAAPEAEEESSGESENPWSVGDRVFAYWESDEYYYPANVTEVDGDNVYVRFDDQSEAWINYEYALAYEVEVDYDIECKWSQDGQYYSAKVLAVKDDQVQVRFEDDNEEWASLSSVRMWFEE
jgi:hypothetical protein